MNKKLFAVIAVVIVVVAAVAIAMAMGGSEKKSEALTGSGRLLVYGNADNNDYLDDKDVETIQKIVDDGKWDKEEYPLADANHDGAVTKDDVYYLKKLL